MDSTEDHAFLYLLLRLSICIWVVRNECWTKNSLEVDAIDDVIKECKIEVIKKCFSNS